MAAATDYTESMVVNALLRGQAFTNPTNIFVALHTADPGEGAGANEVTTTQWPSYTRIDSRQGDTLANAWSAPSGGNGESKNQKQMLYPVYNGTGSLTVTHFSLFNASTGGTMLIKSPLGTSRTIQPGDVFVVDVEKLTVRVL